MHSPEARHAAGGTPGKALDPASQAPAQSALAGPHSQFGTNSALFSLSGCFFRGCMSDCQPFNRQAKIGVGDARERVPLRSRCFSGWNNARLALELLLDRRRQLRELHPYGVAGMQAARFRQQPEYVPVTIDGRHAEHRLQTNLRPGRDLVFHSSHEALELLGGGQELRTEPFF